MKNCIAKIRKSKNMSQQQLADDIHTNRAYLSKIENGISIPSVKLGVRIAEALGINVEDIFLQIPYDMNDKAPSILPKLLRVVSESSKNRKRVNE